MVAGCSGDTAGLLAPSLCAFYTFTVFPGFPSTSLVVASQSSVRFSPLHAGGSKAQSFVFSSLTTLTPLVISSNLVPLNTTSMPTPPTFISPHQIQAGVINIATLIFNSYTKLNSPTETPNLSSQTCFAYSSRHSSWWQLHFSSCSGQQPWSHPGHLSFSNSHLIHWLDINLIQNLPLLITPLLVSFPRLPLSLHSLLQHFLTGFPGFLPCASYNIFSAQLPEGSL